MDKFAPVWDDVGHVRGIRYVCGYCGTDTTPSFGWNSMDSSGIIGYTLICTNCNKPSFIETLRRKITRTTPAAKLGKNVSGLPDEVQNLYDEARKCTSIGAYTSTVLTCRKILMHVAVEKGAEEGKKFIDYVDYLAEKNYIPPNGKDWVDYIRSKANEANHEIVIMEHKEADDLISFTEMLLRLVYEFKHRLQKDEPEKQDT